MNLNCTFTTENEFEIISFYKEKLTPFFSRIIFNDIKCLQIALDYFPPLFYPIFIFQNMPLKETFNIVQNYSFDLEFETDEDSFNMQNIKRECKIRTLIIKKKGTFSFLNIDYYIKLENRSIIEICHIGNLLPINLFNSIEKNKRYHHNMRELQKESNNLVLFDIDDLQLTICEQKNRILHIDFINEISILWINGLIHFIKRLCPIQLSIKFNDFFNTNAILCKALFPICPIIKIQTVNNKVLEFLQNISVSTLSQNITIDINGNDALLDLAIFYTCITNLILIGQNIQSFTLNFHPNDYLQNFGPTLLDIAEIHPSLIYINIGLFPFPLLDRILEMRKSKLVQNPFKKESNLLQLQIEQAGIRIPQELKAFIRSIST